MVVQNYAEETRKAAIALATAALVLALEVALCKASFEHASVA
jgi:hypothetical protein